MQQEFDFKKGNTPNTRNSLAFFLEGGMVMHNKKWWSAKQIIGLCPEFGTDKDLRDLANNSGGRVISGQNGYCLMDYATQEEIDHAANWLISQGKKMIKRGIEIRNRYHNWKRLDAENKEGTTSPAMP